MKKFFTLIAFLAVGNLSFAQTCTPDSSVINAAFPVQPLPYDSITGLGGIPDTACIGKYFEFSFTAALADTFSLNGTSAQLDSIRLPLVGGVTNLPEGVTYGCSPGDCVFRANTLGCVLLSGTVTDPALVGSYDLKLNVQLFLNGASFPLPITLPIPAVTPGSYTLVVREADFSNCASVGAFEPLEELVTLKNVPNPFSTNTTIEVTSHVNSEVSFEVSDMTGRRIHSEKVNLVQGKNTIPFVGSDLSDGIYFYSLKNELGTVSGKMVVSK